MYCSIIIISVTFENINFYCIIANGSTCSLRLESSWEQQILATRWFWQLILNIRWSRLSRRPWRIWRAATSWCNPRSRRRHRHRRHSYASQAASSPRLSFLCDTEPSFLASSSGFASSAWTVLSVYCEATPGKIVLQWNLCSNDNPKRLDFELLMKWSWQSVHHV